MSDEIIGIAVLAPTDVPLNGKVLHVVCLRADGVRGTCDINVIEGHENTPPPGNRVWVYTKQGKSLRCHPSLNYISFKFHNSYNWQVAYVEMALRDNQNHWASRVLQEINLPDLTEAQRQERIAELRAEGVLKP